MTPREYVASLRRGERPVELSGLFGRLGRLKPEQRDVRGLAEEDRPLAWLFGAEALERFDPRRPRELACAVGKTNDEVDASVARGERWYLVVCREPEARPVTWESLFDLAGKLVPEVRERLARHRETIVRARTRELLGDEFDEAERNKEPGAPRHLTTERLLAGEDSARRLRVWLWHSLGVNPLFSGDGTAEHANGGRGHREFVAPNRTLRDDDEVLWLAMR